MAMMGNLFGRSPIRPMQKHMHAAVACARMVVPLVEAMSSGGADALPGLRSEIDRLEHEADDSFPAGGVFVGWFFRLSLNCKKRVS